ncbi:alpha/beta hydrolase [Marinomonas lutimaris]|uniref:alpha/beta hydrolase n=1 Tax=Marinomonas lutimaris TaxID=2846746 RepID=UPI001CA4DCEB|nr:alpha/beta hydrolase [Marinomonas lutimaris]
MNKGLTVFLGGAGMNGGYQLDMVDSLRQSGIKDSVYGNYSGWFKGVDQKIPASLDTLGDASAVVFYNQDENDPIALQLVNTNGCKVESNKSALGLVLRKYSGKNTQGEDCNKYIIRYELENNKKIKFSLAELEIKQLPPKEGQFNFIGYSWGAVIAARSALYYARSQVKIDNLVLIGAPINASLLMAVKTNPHIKNVLVINLDKYGDPIYAGMSDVELIRSVPDLASQMNRGKGEGHFYYALEGGEGAIRRKILAKKLFQEGLR